MRSLTRSLILSLTILLAAAGLAPPEALATVTTTTARNQYTGNGATTVFPYTFRVLASTDIVVYLNDVIQASGYTVSGVGATTGGNVTFTAAPANGVSIVFLRNVPLTQQTDYVQNAPLPAETLEKDLDKGTMIDQRLQEQINRSVLLPPSSTLSGIQICNPGAGFYLRWNLAGTQLECVSAVVDSGSYLGSGTGAVSRSIQSKLGDFVSVKDFGAAGDGVADDGPEVQAALDHICKTTLHGGTVYFPPGVYHSSVNLTCGEDVANQSRSVSIVGYGARITTTGTVWGFTLRGGKTTGRRSVYGLTIDHRNNAAAFGGFLSQGTWNAAFVDCTVIADDVNATYGALVFQNINAADGNTGAFWNRVERFWVRREQGADGANIPVGISIQGNSNALTIRDSGINHADTGVLIVNQGGQIPVANAVLIEGTAFESVTTGITITGLASSVIKGIRIIGNRFESVTTALSITGVTAQVSNPVLLLGNQYTVVTTTLNNPNNINVLNLDSETVAVPGSTGVHTMWRGVAITASGGSEFPLDVITGGSGRGIRVRDVNDLGGLTPIQIVRTGTSTRAAINAGADANIHLTAIRSLSNTTTNSENLRGSCTFAGAATCAVTFGTAEVNATYFVTLGCSASETFWWSAKGTGGFTLNSSNATSAATCDWHLIR